MGMPPSARPARASSTATRGIASWSSLGMRSPPPCPAGRSMRPPAPPGQAIDQAGTYSLVRMHARMARGRLGAGTVAAGRGTNLALLALVPIALTSGALAFAVGTGWVRWVVVAHGVAGFAIVGLSPWKTAVVRRGLRRRRRGRTASMTLLVL